MKEKKYGSINKTFWARNIIIFISLMVSTAGIIQFKNEINTYIGLILGLYVSVIENHLNQYFLAVKKQVTSSMLSITDHIVAI